VLEIELYKDYKIMQQQAPKWCENAIATIRGWEHPVTGELLVSKRGLLTEVIEAPVEVLTEVVEAIVDAPVEVLTEVVEAPVQKPARKK
jgi:hypothetical protein